MIDNAESRKAFVAACDLIPKVIEATRAFPKEEAFGLTLALRKTTITTAATLAAASSRNTGYASVACLLTSLRQVQDLGDIVERSCERGFLSEETGSGLIHDCHEIIGCLTDLIARLVN